MTTTTYNDPALAGEAVTSELLGQVMSYVAVTAGSAALAATKPDRSTR